jgi:hypothetical protein
MTEKKFCLIIQLPSYRINTAIKNLFAKVNLDIISRFIESFSAFLKGNKLVRLSLAHVYSLD